jgi:hypothetical protein
MLPGSRQPVVSLVSRCSSLSLRLIRCAHYLPMPTIAIGSHFGVLPPPNGFWTLLKSSPADIGVSKNVIVDSSGLYFSADYGLLVSLISQLSTASNLDMSKIDDIVCRTEEKKD